MHRRTLKRCGNPSASKGVGAVGIGSCKKRTPVCNGLDKGPALRRKPADLQQVRRREPCASFKPTRRAPIPSGMGALSRS